MTYHVHLLHKPEDEYFNYLKELVDANVALTAGEKLPDPAEFHMLFAGRPSPEHMTASPNLQTLVIPWAGLPPEARDLALKHNLPVHNLHHNAGNVTEMVMALLLAAAHHIVPIDQKLRQHDWRPRYEDNPSVLLHGKTALILGYGHIGRKVATVLKALDMNIMATRRHVEKTITEDDVTIHPGSELKKLLPKANVLIVCLPLTSETEGLLGQEELNLLPQKSLLINIGRGPIIDEEALYNALKDGPLHAAGLDVWYNYPTDNESKANTPPSKFPFHELDNVVMSPHRGGFFGTGETETMRMEAMAQLINAAATGKEIPNRVDVQRGY